MFKVFGRTFFDWDDFMSTVNFYRFNPHKLPPVSRLLCKMGRHDYEPSAVLGPDHVMLECVYCLQKKSSRFHRVL